MFTATGILTLIGGISTAAILDKLLGNMGHKAYAEIIKTVSMLILWGAGFYFTIQFLNAIVAIFLSW